MYAAASDWAKLPDVLRVLFRMRVTRAGGRSERVALLLDLEKNAIEAGAADEFAALVDELLEQGIASPEALRSLKRARVRVLSSDAARQEDASAGHRELVESSALDEDVRAFETFIESQVRAPRTATTIAGGSTPGEPGARRVRRRCCSTGRRREEEFGETDAAIAVYQRLADLEPGRKDALEALCRLKLHAGDFEGGLGGAAIAARRGQRERAASRSSCGWRGCCSRSWAARRRPRSRWLPCSAPFPRSRRLTR